MCRKNKHQTATYIAFGKIKKQKIRANLWNRNSKKYYREIKRPTIFFFFFIFNFIWVQFHWFVCSTNVLLFCKRARHSLSLSPIRGNCEKNFLLFSIYIISYYFFFLLVLLSWELVVVYTKYCIWLLSNETVSSNRAIQ